MTCIFGKEKLCSRIEDNDVYCFFILTTTSHLIMKKSTYTITQQKKKFELSFELDESVK